MIDDELNNLIDSALVDGNKKISSLEKGELEKHLQMTDALISKAREKGVSINELNAAVQAKIAQQKQQLQSPSPMSPPTPPPPQVIKCPACNDIIPPLTRVCPSCGYVIETLDTPSGRSTNLDTLVSEMEETLAKIKSLPAPSFFSMLFAKAHIIIPVYTVVLFFFTVRSIYYMYAGGLFFWASVFFVVRHFIYRKSAAANAQTATTFAGLKADFDRYTNIARTYFGQNKKVSQLLDGLNTELTILQQKKQQNNKSLLLASIASLSLLVIIFAIPFFIKTPTLNESIAADNKQKLSSLSKTEYAFDKDSVYIQGNVGKYFIVNNNGIKVTPSISPESSDDKIYAISTSPIKLSIKPGGEKGLTSAINKLMKGCTASPKKLGYCADMDIYLSFENANGEEITALGKLNTADSALFNNFLQSGSNTISVVFSKSNLAKADVETLNFTKDISINIIGTKK